MASLKRTPKNAGFIAKNFSEVCLSWSQVRPVSDFDFIAHSDLG